MTPAANEPTSRERRVVLYSGRVQGVGFRYTTRRVASQFDVFGFVKNLPDGRVEVVAEGTCGELTRFLDAVQTAMVGYIAKSHIEAGPATGEFSSFDVRF